jgi:hypothetical protein
MLMLIIGSIVAGLAVAGIIAIIHALFKKIQARRLARANQLAAKEAESQRLAQRRTTRIFSPVGIRIPQGTGVGGSLTTNEDPWAGAQASGFASVVRDNLRSRRLTPAGYARGDSGRKAR